MDSLIIIVVTLVVIARCWKMILTIFAGICATFLGGALTGLITGLLTHKYLDGKYPDTLNDDPNRPPEDDTPCTSPKPPLLLTASARRTRDSRPSSSGTGGRYTRN
jgi:hypothetical protein